MWHVRDSQSVSTGSDALEFVGPYRFQKLTMFSSEDAVSHTSGEEIKPVEIRSRTFSDSSVAFFFKAMRTTTHWRIPRLRTCANTQIRLHETWKGFNPEDIITTAICSYNYHYDLTRGRCKHGRHLTLVTRHWRTPKISTDKICHNYV